MVVLGGVCRAQKVAITLDDLPPNGDLPPEVSSLLWKEALREGQMQDRLQMISLRKEVEQMSLFDAVSRCNEHRQVTG